MENHEQKMDDFVQKLWTNPNIQSSSLLKKENQILSFIRENTVQLKNIFNQPDYFQGLAWDKAIGMLLTVLTKKVISEMTIKLDNIFYKIDIRNIDIFSDFTGELIWPAYKDLIIQQLYQKNIRDHYSLVINAIEAGFVDKYIPHIYEKRKNIYNEIIRREKINQADPKDTVNFFNLTLLVRPFNFIKLSANDQEVSIAQTGITSPLYKTLLIEVKNTIQSATPFSEKLISFGIESCHIKEEKKEISGIAKLLGIFIERAKDYEQNQKVDRGAENPDTSWLNIHRKNAKYYGFDNDMMYELYQIAGEESW